MPEKSSVEEIDWDAHQEELEKRLKEMEKKAEGVDPTEYLRKAAGTRAASALDTQVGGSHYKDFVLQPVEFITRNGLGFLPGCIIKRLCRFDKAGGKGMEDLKKLRHEVDLMIEMWTP